MYVLSNIASLSTAGWQGTEEELRVKLHKALDDKGLLVHATGYLWDNGIWVFEYSNYSNNQYSEVLIRSVRHKVLTSEHQVMDNLIMIAMMTPIEKLVKYLDKNSCIELRTVVKLRMEGLL